VGNPLLDNTDADLKANIKRYDDARESEYKLALLPGSRDAEIEHLWEPMQKIAMRIRQSYPKTKFVAAAVDDRRLHILQDRQLEGFECEYSLGKVYQTCLQSDFALTASGSATLEVAAAGCPMAVMYQANRMMWHCVGRWLIKLEHLSLVNILAGRELVAEFMPYFKSIIPITDFVTKNLADKDMLRDISCKLVEITSNLKQYNASEKTADIIRNMLSV
jgi:lipid-A-disaccharide synthase